MHIKPNGVVEYFAAYPHHSIAQPLLVMSGAMAQAMPDRQLWHHFTPSIYGSSHARWAVLAVDGLDDAVAAGVHHERSLPPLRDTGGACAFAEGDDAKSVHQACAEGDDAKGVHHTPTLLRGGGGE